MYSNTTSLHITQLSFTVASHVDCVSPPRDITFRIEFSSNGNCVTVLSFDSFSVVSQSDEFTGDKLRADNKKLVVSRRGTSHGEVTRCHQTEALHADSRVLKVFANMGIEFIIGLGNEYLSKMATDRKNALNWVKQNVQCHFPATKITCIYVGNEVLAFNDTELSSSLLSAMEGIHAALVSLGLDKQVNVTTAHSLAVLQTSGPPSSGAFMRDLVPCVTQILNFQTKIGSPFMINACPYFAYKASPK